MGTYSDLYPQEELFNTEGIENSCRWYHCAVMPKDWEKGHIRMNEHCGHLTSKYQQESNSENINLHGAQTEIDTPTAGSTSNVDVPTMACLENGYNKPDIENAKELYERRTGKRDYAAMDLAEIIEEETNGELDIVSAESLCEENRKLKDRLAGQRCTDRTPCLLCGHLRECRLCAGAMLACTSCPDVTMATVKGDRGTTV